MKILLSITIIVLVLGAIASANPIDTKELQREYEKNNKIELPKLVPGGHIGVSKDRTFVDVAATQNIWKSQNKKHEIDIYGKYKQFFGKNGNSPPKTEAGIIYTFNFPNKN